MLSEKNRPGTRLGCIGRGREWSVYFTVCHTQTWIFGQSDGSARLQREGHSAPPTHVCFYTKGSLGLLTSDMTPMTCTMYLYGH